VTAMINEHARAMEPGFTRLMIEKPFGRDSESFDELNEITASCFHETQLFRMNHYVGKEVILNISTLRWANQVRGGAAPHHTDVERTVVGWPTCSHQHWPPVSTSAIHFPPI
jgi:glucose-6-phosphate 1-dehydrogenase